MIRRLLLLFLAVASITRAQVTVSLAPVPRMQFLNASGVPLAGGFVYTYAAGTTTPQATYTDFSGTIQNTNPVVLDSGGRATIWIAAVSYKFCVADANNVQQWCVDNVSDAALIDFQNAVLISGTQTITGNKTFSGNVNFTGSGSTGNLSLGAVALGPNSWTGNQSFTSAENTFYVENYSSSSTDYGVRANAAITAMPSTGGKLSFCGASGAIAAATTITVNKPMIVEFCGTALTVNGNPGFSVTANGVRFSGTTGLSQIIQGTMGNNIIQNTTALSDFEVSGITFLGTCASLCAPTNTNSAIYLTGNLPGTIARINVHDNVFQNFIYGGVITYNATDVQVKHNTFTAMVTGVRFGGVNRGWIANNDFNSTNAPNATFVSSVALESTNPIGGSSYAPPNEIHISHNTFDTFINGEAILIHAGTNVSVSGNVIYNTLFGIGVSPFQIGDTTANISIVGNTYSGTSSTGAGAATGNYGIFVGGGAGFTANHVTVSGNVINGANQISTNTGGGIGVTYADDVLVTGNVIQNTTGAPIIAQNATRLVMRGNTATNATGTNGYGLYVIGAGITGSAEGNTFDTMTGAFRADVASTGFLLGTNGATNLTGSKITNPANFTVASLFDGRIKIADQGTCTMTSGACTAQNLSGTYANAPVCFLTFTGTGTLAGNLKIASTVTTVTPSSSSGTDSAVVNWVCLGN